MTLLSTLSPTGAIGTPLAAAQLSELQPFKELFFSPAPWMFFVLGLWLAYLLWHRKHLLSLRHSRSQQVELSNRLRSIIDQQNETLDWLTYDFAREKKRWSLQVINRDQILKDLRCKMSRFDATTDQYEADIASQDRELSLVKNELAAKSNKEKSFDSKLEGREDYGNRIDDLELQLQDREHSLATFKKDHLQLEMRINELELEVTEKANEIFTLETELTENRGARQKLSEIDKVLEDRDTKMNQLREKREQSNAELNARITELENELEPLRLELQNRDREIGQLRNDHEASRNRVEELETNLREQNQPFESVCSEKDGLFTKLQETEWLLGERDEELRQVSEEKQALEHRLSNQESRTEADRIQELEWLLGERDEQIQAFNDAKESKQQEAEKRISELEWLMGERDAELERLRHEVGEKTKIIEETTHGDHSAYISRIHELEWLMGERDAELEHLRLGNQTHQDSRTRIAELEWLLGERDADLEKSRSEANHLNYQLQEKEDALRDLKENEGSTFLSRIQELEWLISERDGELQALRSEKETLSHKLSFFSEDNQNRLKTEIEHNRGKIRVLESRLRERDHELKELKSTQHRAVGFQGEDVNEDNLLGIVYQSRPEKVDDLKLINGIAGVLESKLHEQGIYRFKQIAIWNHQQIAEFGERLVSKDRIVRDQWVPQAIDLHRKNYGEHIAPGIDLYQKQKKAAKPLTDIEDESPAPDPELAASKLQTFSDDGMKIDRLLGPIFNSRPEQVDDLSQLEGITDQFVTRLHNFGVYRYQQIAQWTPNHLKQFRLLLSVNGNGRLDVDQWTNQAAELHSEHHTETLEE